MKCVVEKGGVGGRHVCLKKNLLFDWDVTGVHMSSRFGLATEGLGLVGNLAEWVGSTVLLDTPMMDYSVFKSSM